MKILVIGGSYFLGRHFVNLALEEGMDITVFNRGTRPYNSGRIKELTGDRAVEDDLKKINGNYDAIVDFCGYRKGDILSVKKTLDGCFGRYVFVSTVDVYKRGTGRLLNEDAELETRDFGGEAGAYILGKASLEEEIIQCDDYCIIRPAVIYGPGNYAPRENIYFKWISAAHQVLEPEPSDGFFQMVYVKDVARALLNACKNEGYSKRAFNLSPPELITYRRFTEILKLSTEIDFEVIKITPEESFSAQVPFPFAMTAPESEKYDSSSIIETGFEFTDITDGMKESWRQYVHS